MSIVRDDNDERETRVDRMIAEFRRAQWRRAAKATPVTIAAEAAEVKHDARVPPGMAVSSPAALTVELE